MKLNNDSFCQEVSLEQDKFHKVIEGRSDNNVNAVVYLNQRFLIFLLLFLVKLECLNYIYDQKKLCVSKI